VGKINILYSIARSLLNHNRDRDLLILTYHRMLRQADEVIDDVHQLMFERQLSVLTKYFNVLPLNKAAKLLQQNALPPRSVCITFDDGYLDNYDVALPILKKWRMPATFFIATAYMGGLNMWNDVVIDAFKSTHLQHCDLTQFGLSEYLLYTPTQRKNAAYSVLGKWKYENVQKRDLLARQLSAKLEVSQLPRLMMNADEIRHLVRAGMEIGAHTVSHPILQKLDHAQAQKEIEDSKHILEEITGKSVNSFAYPNGRLDKDYSYVHVDMVKAAGFEVAVTTNWGKAERASAVHELPRLGFQEQQSLIFGLKMLHAYT
jgi:peptidoglycan/xylan/chitin deacetylase (PgdA/CDA1 family)